MLLPGTVESTAPPTPDYFNTVALTSTTGAAEAWRRRHDEALRPHALLKLTQDLERRAGRRPAARYADRTLDVDLLLVGDAGLASAALSLPHPRLRERRFVLAPLNDLAPGLALPPDGRRVADVLSDLGMHQDVERLSWRQPPAGAIP